MPAGGQEKAATAYRTISEVADDLDLPQHVLRFWETRFPQLRPRKGPGGRRYYRPADIDLLRRIRKLLYDDGFTIRGAQMALRELRKTPSIPVPTAAPAAPEQPVQTRAPADAKTETLRGVLEELRDLRRSLPTPAPD